jgi:hypothetical protein
MKKDRFVLVTFYKELSNRVDVSVPSPRASARNGAVGLGRDNVLPFHFSKSSTFLQQHMQVCVRTACLKLSASLEQAVNLQLVTTLLI